MYKLPTSSCSSYKPACIVLSSDETALFISESGKYRVWKIAVAARQLELNRSASQLTSQPTPLASVVFDNLPGYPDNLTRDQDGKIWLGLAGQRNFLDFTAERPYLRMLWKMPPSYGHVIAFKEDGKVIADLQDPSGDSPTLTGVSETANRLYSHNINGKGLGWMAR